MFHRDKSRTKHIMNYEKTENFNLQMERFIAQFLNLILSKQEEIQWRIEQLEQALFQKVMEGK